MSNTNIITNSGFDLVIPFSWHFYERNGLHSNQSRFLCTDSGTFSQEWYGSYSRYFTQEQFLGMQHRLNQATKPDLGSFDKDRIKTWHCFRLVNTCTCRSICCIPISILTLPCVIGPWKEYVEKHAEMRSRLHGAIEAENEKLQARLNGAADLVLYKREHKLYDACCWDWCLDPAELVHTLRIRCGSTANAAAAANNHHAHQQMASPNYGVMGDDYHDRSPAGSPVTGTVVGDTAAARNGGGEDEPLLSRPPPQQQQQQQKIFCPECGKPMKPNDKFCSACGTKNESIQ